MPQKRTRSILTEEQQQELVRDYLAGMRRVDMSAKYALFPTQIYAYLRRNGVQANRHPRKERVAICSICGEVRQMPPYSPSNYFRALPTCGDSVCLALLLFRPELHLRHYITQPSHNHSHSKKHYWSQLTADSESHKEITQLDETELAALEMAFHLGTDESGQDISEEARRALWGRLSELSIAVHLRADHVGDSALTLSAKRPLHEFLRAFFGSNAEESAVLADAFDVVYLWRCLCPQQCSYVIRKVADFPTQPGEYGVCPMCGSSALVIE